MTPPALALAALLPALAGSSGTVLVDGRSGSGKTTFAAALARTAGARLLRMDDLYPGWSGLEAASRALVADVLVPRRAGVAGRYRRWDWAADRPGERAALPAEGALVVEGCGALSRAAARFATVTAWVELPEEERRRRALTRDGDAYRPWWGMWAHEERAFIAREDPRRAAGLVVDGRHFPESVFGGRTADVH